MPETGGAPAKRVGVVTSTVIPSVLTAVAFGAGSNLGLVGDLPLWVLLALLVGAGALGQISGKFVRPDASALAMHCALAAQVLPVSAIIYAIGWGPTLTVGYVFVISRALDAGGSRVWKATLGWMTLGVFLGQIAIVLGIVPSYVPERYVHGLAALGVLGMAFVVWLI